MSDVTTSHPTAQPSDTETATFGAGCFWCVEAAFRSMPGVVSVTPGYMGGHTENPSYQDVCSGLTGHAEVVQLRFDPGVVTYRQLLDIFWRLHDPTTLNRQGPDVGTQYRSVVFCHNDEQRALAEALKTELNASDKYDGEIVTEITVAPTFYEAEAYHRDYYRQNPNQPYCRIHIAPKLRKFGVDPTS